MDPVLQENTVMAAKVLRKVTHCLFDMDGLLLDTERLYTEASKMTLSPFGKTFTFEVKEQMMGLQTREAAEFMVKHYSLPIPWEELAQQQRANTEKLMRHSQLMPGTHTPFCSATTRLAEMKAINVFLEGAERLLRHLHENQVPFALATSSSSEMMELKSTDHRELFGLFNHKVCGTDSEVANGKPAPDIFLVAAGRFVKPPAAADCLVFEDSPNGVTAGNSAGMQVVMVPDPRLSPEKCSHATQVLRSLADFKPEQFGLPPFKD